jgi:hypothetical protein
MNTLYVIAETQEEANKAIADEDEFIRMYDSQAAAEKQLRENIVCGHCGNFHCPYKLKYKVFKVEFSVRNREEIPA